MWQGILSITNALAAVGASPSVINMLMGFFMGLSTTLWIDGFLQPPLNKKAAAFSVFTRNKR